MHILDFLKNEYVLNELNDFFYKMNISLNKYFGFSLPEPKMAPNVSNISEIIQGLFVGPISVHFKGSKYL